MARTLLTEQDIRDAARNGLRAVPVPAGALVTPSARDAAKALGIEIVVAAPAGEPVTGTPVQAVVHTPEQKAGVGAKGFVVAIGSDHGGFRLKEDLRGFVLDLGHTVIDVGTHTDAPCDYPDLAYAVARLVAEGKADRGIAIDAIGTASAIVANKVPGIRAALATTEYAVRSSREHNDANVLTLGGRVMGTDLARTLVKVWLETWFGGGRHQQRLRKISDIEHRLL